MIQFTNFFIFIFQVRNRNIGLNEKEEKNAFFNINNENENNKYNDKNDENSNDNYDIDRKYGLDYLDNKNNDENSDSESDDIHSEKKKLLLRNELIWSTNASDSDYSSDNDIEIYDETNNDHDVENDSKYDMK